GQGVELPLETAKQQHVRRKANTEERIDNHDVPPGQVRPGRPSPKQLDRGKAEDGSVDDDDNLELLDVLAQIADGERFAHADPAPSRIGKCISPLNGGQTRARLWRR